MKTEEEKWKDIPGYEGYIISDKGRVISKRNPVASALKSKKGLLYLGTDNSGYVTCTLYTGPKKKSTVRVHRIVAIAFIDRVKDCMFVNHKNGIKTDNRVDNLEWVNRSQNHLHAYATGLQDKPKGEANPYRKLSNLAVYDILSSPLTGMALALKYKVSPSCISSVRRGKNWSHIR